MGVITFDGISSNSVGVTVEGYHSAPMAEKSVDRIHVPGRSGDLIIENGSLLNYNQKYTMHWQKSEENRNAVVKWLYRSGYRKFSDGENATHFRMASLIGRVDVDSRMDVLDRAVFEFDFKPQRFLTSGDAFIYFTGTGEKTISNPTRNKATPIIRIYGNGTLTFDHGATIKVSGSDPYFWTEIDCETLNCTSGETQENVNNLVTFSGDPFLRAGNSKINVGSGITAVEIKPRWWEL